MGGIQGSRLQRSQTLDALLSEDLQIRQEPPLGLEFLGNVTVSIHDSVRLNSDDGNFHKFRKFNVFEVSPSRVQVVQQGRKGLELDTIGIALESNSNLHRNC
jgi:hypothetical protein